MTPLVGRIVPDHDLKQRRFSRAVGADYPARLPLRDREIHAGQSLEAGPSTASSQQEPIDAPPEAPMLPEAVVLPYPFCDNRAGLGAVSLQIGHLRSSSAIVVSLLVKNHQPATANARDSASETKIGPSSGS